MAVTSESRTTWNGSLTEGSGTTSLLSSQAASSAQTVPLHASFFSA